MIALLKKISVVSTILAMSYAGQAFSLLGPWADWQTLDLGYQYDTATNPVRDPGGPMALQEGFRINFPTMTYAFDKSFIDEFGEKGVAEVERAFQTVNDTFAHMYDDGYLDSVPTSTIRYNYRAETLGLQDLYSTILEYVTEKMGLASPERYAWTLRQYEAEPDTYYTIRRNYDPDTLETTPYVNGVLYSFRIVTSGNTGTEGTNITGAEALEILPDPNAQAYTSVAGASGNIHQGNSRTGTYYTGLTRDDVGGLRWLYSAGNYAFEGVAASAGSIAIQVPDYGDPQIITNIDLVTFLEAVENTTNTTEQVLALYPSLNIIDRDLIITNTIRTNATVFYTNSPWAPVDAAQILWTNYTYTTNIQFRYNYKYDNVYTNYGGYVTNDNVLLMEISNGEGGHWLPVDAATGTNYFTNYTTYTTNRAVGGIIILGATTSTNVTDTNGTTGAGVSGYTFVYTNPIPTRVWVTNWISLTNGVTANTNATTTTDTNTTGISLPTIDTGATTNDTTSTNATVDFFKYQALIHTYLVYEYVAYPIIWSSTAATGTDSTNVSGSGVLYRPGLGNNFRWQRVNFDGLISTSFTETNIYYSNIVYMNLTNALPGQSYGQLETVTMRRTLTRPDIIITAADNDPTGGSMNADLNTFVSFSTYNTALTTDHRTGPGIISGLGDIIFNTAVNDFWVNNNTGPIYLFEREESRSHCWASFDGTTNAPIIYPISAGRTIEWLEQQLTNKLPDTIK